jgi:hypothetical protein
MSENKAVESEKLELTLKVQSLEGETRRAAHAQY